MIWQRITSKRLLLVMVVVGVILCGRLLVEYAISSQYQSLVNNSEIVEAFLGNNAKAIEAVVAHYGLEYQQIEHGKIIASTSSALPLPTIIPVHTVFADGVLRERHSENLGALAPLRFIYKGRIYAGATLFPPDLDLPGYIVYTKVLP